MKELSVNLKDIDTAVFFVGLNKKQNFEIDVKIGRYLLDGKSDLGILGCAVGHEIVVRLLTSDETEIGEYEKQLAVLLSDN